MLSSPQFTSPVGLGKTGLTAFGIGLVFGISVTVLVMQILWKVMVIDGVIRYMSYLTCLCVFHFSEFLLTAAFKPGFVNYDSFLINHSTAYTIAFVACQVEFWVEWYLYPTMKQLGWTYLAGVILLVLGHYFRIGAMYTAKSNFSHIIEVSKRKEHQLITHGVYRFIRHPSYLGWFLWSIGTQLVVGNPICTVFYTLASWDFFRHRIPYEESLLMEFFPNEYPEYKKRSISGMPFI